MLRAVGEYRNVGFRQTKHCSQFIARKGRYGRDRGPARKQPTHRSVDGQIAPIEEIGPAEDLCVVDDDDMIAMKHRSGIGQTDQATSSGGARKFNLIPGMSAQPSYLANLDASEIDRFARLARNEQLPLCSSEGSGQLVGRKQDIDRFDQFGGITLNAGQLLREKAAVDEEFQVVTVADRVRLRSCAAWIRPAVESIEPILGNENMTGKNVVAPIYF